MVQMMAARSLPPQRPGCVRQQLGAYAFAPVVRVDIEAVDLAHAEADAIAVNAVARPAHDAAVLDCDERIGLQGISARLASQRIVLVRTDSASA